MSDEPVPGRLKAQVALRAGDCCEYCRSQARFAMQPFSVEHIEPRSQEGTNTFDNLVLACQGVQQSPIQPDPCG
jgi:HNH endonuclease